MNKLLLALNNYQEKAGLTTCELADRIGLHFATLYRLKQGSRGAGTKVLRALNQIPQLRKAVSEFISGDNTSLKLHQKRYKPFLGRVRGWVRAILSRDITIR